MNATLVLTIEGVSYSVEPAPGQWVLTREGETVTVGPYACSCGAPDTCRHLWAFWLYAGIPCRRLALCDLGAPV